LRLHPGVLIEVTMYASLILLPPWIKKAKLYLLESPNPKHAGFN
jgi:hypothetical protein